MKRSALAAYLLAGVICGGHASSGLYDDARQDGRSTEDAALIAGVAGLGAAIGWPIYVTAKLIAASNR